MVHLKGRKAPDFPPAGSDGKTHALKDHDTHPQLIVDIPAVR